MTNRYLIVIFGNYGDCLFATTIAKQLKYDEINCKVDWAISEKYSNILNNNPYIDNIINVPFEGDIYTKSWIDFKKKIENENTNKYNKIFFSQIHPDNWSNYDGTIRGTILSGFKSKFRVDKRPVVRLTQNEVDNVNIFIKQNNINKYQYIVFVECSPTSGQSYFNLELALEISKSIVTINKDICFILSTPSKINLNVNSIVDASILSFRENAELLKVCTHFVGCSSGFTWLATSDWVNKEIPMLQILNKDYEYFAGVKYDFLKHGLNNYVNETTSTDNLILKQKIIDLVFNKKSKIYSYLKPSYRNFYYVFHNHLNSKINRKTLMFLYNNKKNNKHYSIFVLFFLFFLGKRINFNNYIFKNKCL